MGKIFRAIGLGVMLKRFMPKPPKPIQTPVAPEPKPVESTALGVEARDTIGDESSKIKTAMRTQLLETQGGILGEELEEGKVKRRNTLLGN